MERLDSDVAMATAAVISDAVAAFLQEEQQREFFSLCYEAIRAGLAKRDELYARERKRLGKPNTN